MKKLLFLAPIILLTIVLIGCEPQKILYNEGTYEGTGQGHHGPIKVQVTVDQYDIMEIKVLEQQETPQLSDIVYNKIPQRVIKANSADVSVVAGATFTSDGFIEAIRSALDKAIIKE